MTKKKKRASEWDSQLSKEIDAIETIFQIIKARIEIWLVSVYSESDLSRPVSTPHVPAPVSVRLFKNLLMEGNTTRLII